MPEKSLSPIDELQESIDETNKRIATTPDGRLLEKRTSLLKSTEETIETWRTRLATIGGAIPALAIAISMFCEPLGKLIIDEVNSCPKCAEGFVTMFFAVMAISAGAGYAIGEVIGRRKANKMVFLERKRLQI